MIGAEEYQTANGVELDHVFAKLLNGLDASGDHESIGAAKGVEVFNIHSSIVGQLHDVIGTILCSLVRHDVVDREELD